jgi:type IV pilus assembly protein PilQ
MTKKNRAARPGLRQTAAAILAALLTFPPGSIPAAWAQDAVTVDGISVGVDRVQIQLSAEAQYTSRVTANPPRLILDLTGVEYRADAKSFPAKGIYLKDVRASQYQPAPDMVSRVVLDLNEMTGYQITKNDSGLLVTLGSPGQAAGADSPAPDASDSSDQQAPVKPNVGETGGMTTKVSADVNDISARNDATQRATPPEPPPAPAHAAAAAQDPQKASVNSDIMSRLPHDLVSLDFDNTDVRDVIKLLAAKSRINVIYGPDVTGNVTLHLIDVPFDEAFRTILTMYGLSTAQIGSNVLRVVTPATLAKSQSALATATKVIALGYAKAADVLTTVNQVRQAEGRTGTAVAVAATNSLVVTESTDGLAKTELLVAQLDQRPAQVLIEAKIVEVNLTKNMDYGVQWGYESATPGKYGGQQGLNLIGNTKSQGIASSPTQTPLSNNPNVTVPSGAGAGAGTGVSLAQQAAGALTLGRITNNYFLNASLMAAALDDKVKVLSDPKIATLNNQTASIAVNNNIPYVTNAVSATGASVPSVTNVAEGITLSVTPTINADGRITLVVNPQVTEPGVTVTNPTGTAIPGTNTRTAQTTVIVRDGETIVIGGLISDQNEVSISKVPFFGDIPVLGWLFKSKSITRTRTELLIFVTTKILSN